MWSMIHINLTGVVLFLDADLAVCSVLVWPEQYAELKLLVSWIFVYLYPFSIHFRSGQLQLSINCWMHWESCAKLSRQLSGQLIAARQLSTCGNTNWAEFVFLVICPYPPQNLSFLSFAPLPPRICLSCHLPLSPPRICLSCHLCCPHNQKAVICTTEFKLSPVGQLAEHLTDLQVTAFCHGFESYSWHQFFIFIFYCDKKTVSEGGGRFWDDKAWKLTDLYVFVCCTAKKDSSDKVLPPPPQILYFFSEQKIICLD